MSLGAHVCVCVCTWEICIYVRNSVPIDIRGHFAGDGIPFNCINWGFRFMIIGRYLYSLNHLTSIEVEF